MQAAVLGCTQKAEAALDSLPVDEEAVAVARLHSHQSALQALLVQVRASWQGHRHDMGFGEGKGREGGYVLNQAQFQARHRFTRTERIQAFHEGNTSPDSHCDT